MELDIVNEETSKNVRDSIQDRIGADIFTLQIADSILDRFYKNRNETYSPEDFKFPEDSNSLKNFRKGYSEQEFKQDRDKIIDIFVEYGIIEKLAFGKYLFSKNRN